MNVMCLNRPTERRTKLPVMWMLLAATCFCCASVQAQDAWTSASFVRPGYMQPVAYDASVTDFGDGRAVSGDGSTIVFEDYSDDGWGPTSLAADCGYNCPPAWRVSLDYFLLNREGNDGLTHSSGSFISEHDYEEGIRLSLTRHFDCLDAFEITFIGPFNWSNSTFVSGTGLDFLPSATGGVMLNSFDNATFHGQTYRSQFSSLELNSKWVGWDVLTQTVGVRYWNVDEDFTFSSTSGAGTGLFALATDNHAVGIQYGLDMLFPLGRWETNTWLKGGVFGNIVDTSVFLADAGAVQIANSDEDLDFSALGEFGMELSFRVLPNVTLQGGYEVWWLHGIAVAPEQLQGSLNPTTGQRIDADGDTWYHGGTAGVEITW